ncbi:MAG: RNA methyltransferase [Burkholderiaceae bacterium]
MDFQRAAPSVEQGQDSQRLRALLDRVHWVLVSPSHPGNVGATARALKVTGFYQLWQVDSNHALAAQRLADPQALAMASGADDLLQKAHHAENLDQALAPCVLSLAFTARPREFEPPRRNLQDGLQEALDLLCSYPEARVAMVFGAERAGLTNDELMSCSRVCGLSVNPGFGSLNLSQAVQVVAYFLRHLALQEGPGKQASQPMSADPRPLALAPAASVQALYSTLEQLALASGYLNPKEPGRFRDRLQRLASRTQLLEDEAQLLHGLSREILKRLG